PRTWPRVAVRGRSSIVALERVPDQPERRSPQSDEQRPALGVSALVLIHRLRPDPESDAKSDGTHRRGMHLPASQAASMQGLGQHRVMSTRTVTWVCDGHAAPTRTFPPACHSWWLAGWSGADGMALYVAHDAHAQNRGRWAVERDWAAGNSAE